MEVTPEHLTAALTIGQAIKHLRRKAKRFFPKNGGKVWGRIITADAAKEGRDIIAAELRLLRLHPANRTLQEALELRAAQNRLEPFYSPTEEARER